MGTVPGQDVLDAGRVQLVADGPNAPSAAGQQQQQQQFHHLPFLQRAPPHAECFAGQHGYVATLFWQQQEELQHQLAQMQHQQQEALQHWMAQMQQQQLAFIRHQEQLINNIVTSMKVQALPCLGATSDSLGSSIAEEFENDQGDGVSTAWHHRHGELFDGKVRSLNKMAEVQLCRNNGGGGESRETAFRITEPVPNTPQGATSDALSGLVRDPIDSPENIPERFPDVLVDIEERSRGMFCTQLALSRNDHHPPGMAPGLFQQLTLAGSCEAGGCVDDPVDVLAEENHSLVDRQSAAGSPLQSSPVPWHKLTGPWKGENMYSTGLIEVPKRLIVDVNIIGLEAQLRSAAIVHLQSIAVAYPAGRKTFEAMGNTLQPKDVGSAPPPEGRIWKRIRSKLEFEPPPPTTTNPSGEPEKQKNRRTASDAISDKVGREPFWTVDLRTVRQTGGYASERQVKACDVPLELSRYTKSSSASGSTTPTWFDASQQPTWSLGRPPEQLRFGSTSLSPSVSSSTTAASLQSTTSVGGRASTVPLRFSPGRFSMWLDLYHLI